jgi:hypothetical protein
MANVSHWTASWVSMEDSDMAPNDEHGWGLAPVLPVEAYSLTAQPITGDPTQPHRTLAVENIRVVGEPDGGLSLIFIVKNVGNSFIDAYTVGFGIINE